MANATPNARARLSSPKPVGGHPMEGQRGAYGLLPRTVRGRGSDQNATFARASPLPDEGRRPRDRRRDAGSIARAHRSSLEAQTHPSIPVSPCTAAPSTTLNHRRRAHDQHHHYAPRDSPHAARYP